jgi:hypothetical protein
VPTTSNCRASPDMSCRASGAGQRR